MDFEEEHVFVPTKRMPKKDLPKEEKRRRMKMVIVDSSQILASADSYLSRKKGEKEEKEKQSGEGEKGKEEKGRKRREST